MAFVIFIVSWMLFILVWISLILAICHHLPLSALYSSAAFTIA